MPGCYRAGKVRAQTPKIPKKDKKKEATGRANRRKQYNRLVTSEQNRDPNWRKNTQSDYDKLLQFQLKVPKTFEAPKWERRFIWGDKTPKKSKGVLDKDIQKEKRAAVKEKMGFCTEEDVSEKIIKRNGKTIGLGYSFRVGAPSYSYSRRI